MVRLLGHRQTKGAATDKPTLRPPRHIPTLPGRLQTHRPHCLSQPQRDLGRTRIQYRRKPGTAWTTSLRDSQHARVRVLTLTKRLDDCFAQFLVRVIWDLRRLP